MCIRDSLEHCAAAWVARTSPIAFLRLSESIDLHRIDPQTVAVPTIVVAIEEDRLVPQEDLAALAAALQQGTLRVLRSKVGHDAFLVETAAIAALVTETLDLSLIHI